jgi:2-polyprenyl-3-methyl-5-hydroxy-6-metoxy-1,4-benzoquinol methylase
MGDRSLIDRAVAKARRVLGYRQNVRRLAFVLERYSRQLWDGPYQERPEAGATNLEHKLERVRQGGPFEPYDVTLVNRAVAALLAPHHRSILEIGSGTGMFAAVAATSGERRIVASEFNAPAREWAIANRAAPNITYCARPLTSFAEAEFDVVVAVEVIEHLADYGVFLRDVGRVAPEAFLTTPNKGCDPFQSLARMPAFSEHVREWNAGEFYWVLRAFFGSVELYTLPGLAEQVAALRADAAYTPIIVPCSDLATTASLIAWCRDPLPRRALIS